MTVNFTSTEKIWGKNHFKCPNLILNYSQLSIGFTQTSPLLHFSFFIFRALKPCDQDSPISVCNGNQSTTQHVPSTNDHEWHAKEGDSTTDSFVYWKGKHTFLERKAIKNTWPFLRSIEVEEKARVLEEQARIQ